MPPRIIHSLDELRGLAGQEVGSSDWMAVTQEMIDRFADITHDHQWIHVDVERCKRESPFHTTIAHGFLTLSLMSHLQGQSVRVQAGQKHSLNYGLNRLRFTNPVPVGSRIRSRSTLKEVEDVKGGVQCTWLVTIDIENVEKPALVAEWIGRIYP